jgi:hypothetical protein
MYTCLKCGKQFERRQGVKKYCSVVCAQREKQGSCVDCQKPIFSNRLRCEDCRKKISDGVPERTKQLRRKNAYKIGREPRGRHTRLKKFLRKEGIPSTDPLWSLNFYTALIQDGICHYCLGPMSPSGHGLDRKITEQGHTANNVVCCCWLCNTIKGKYWEYEHMMMLAPKLRCLRSLPVAPDGRASLS